MNMIKCNKCGKSFNGKNYPICPDCLSKRWASTSTFVKDKHDPSALPLSANGFRSVLSNEFVNDIPAFTEYAAYNGSWYFSSKHQKYCHFTEKPLATIPGSAIPAGCSMPVSALDGLIEAEAINNPHAFAVDIQSFKSEISAGSYKPLDYCADMGCCNLSLPGTDYCQVHQINEYKMPLA